MAIEISAEAVLSDGELALRFESLGDSCELGLVQRLAGVEPLGLFRFAGAPLRHLIRAMQARFEGMADPASIRIQPENGEYMVKLTKYDFIHHAHVKIGAADPVVLHQQQTRTVRFLIDKLIGDLENSEKIMVFRQNETLSANDLMDFRRTLAAFGPATLLWVQETRPGFPSGTVVVVDDTLMIGYVSRLAPRDNAHDLDIGSWLTMLRKAHALRRKGHIALPANDTAATPPPRRTDVLFGRDGNATALTGDGWSGLENGFTWAIDDRSLLTIDNPGPAARYWLEMDVVPFVSAPLVMAQTLDVAVNGQRVHTFDPLPRGKAGCEIPARLLDGHETIEIELAHPAAASPRTAAGEDDDRRLAVAFYSLSLIGT